MNISYEFAKDLRKKRLQKRFALFFLIIGISLTINFFGNNISYDREMHLTAEMIEFGGCATTLDCPEWVRDGYVKPEKYSKEWWREYCNTVLGTPMACH